MWPILLEPRQLGPNGVRIIGAGYIVAGVLKQIPSAIIPCAQERAKLFDRRAHVAGDGPGEVRKTARAGFDVERGKFGAEGEDLGVYAR